MTSPALKRQALIDLLAQPDDGLRRGHRLTVEGRADRFAMLPRLSATFVQYHRLELEELYARGQVGGCDR